MANIKTKAEFERSVVGRIVLSDGRESFLEVSEDSEHKIAGFKSADKHNHYGQVAKSWDELKSAIEHNLSMNGLIA